MRRRTLLAVMSASAALALAPALPALAARDAARDAVLLADLLRTHALPRFAALAAAAERLADALDRLAEAPSAERLAAGRDGHRAVADAWAGVQHLRPGPLATELRAERISFWPERPGVVQRQIGQLLRDRDPKLLQPGALARQSAAVQGLTVLERLLFDDGVTSASFEGDAGRYRAALAAAAAHGLATVAREVRDGWAALAVPLAAGGPTALGTDASGAVNALFGGAVTSAQIIADQKLQAPLGGGPADAKPTVAEALRSGRSTRNIVLNLEALRALMLGEGGGPGLAALLPDSDEGRLARRGLEEGFAMAIRGAGAISGPINAAVTDPARRRTVETALGMVRGVRAHLVVTVAPLLDIVLGFNELDGD